MANEQDNRTIANRVMGWTEGPYIHLWRDSDSNMRSTSESVTPRTPCRRFLPSTDLNAAHEMEEEIERRGMTGAYLKALGNETRNEHGLVSAWGFAHATAAQRVRAALKVVEE